MRFCLCFENDESSQLLRVPYSPSLAFHGGVLFGDDDDNTPRAQGIVTSEFVVLTLGSFLRTARHIIMT